MTVKQVKIASIKVRKRLRPVDQDYVDVLTSSIIDRNGVQQPITVGEDKRTGALFLVIGGHRLAAAKQAGLDTIPATVVKGKTKDELRLLEIDENLFRNELNALDRASSLAARKEIYERLYPDTKAGVAGGKARQNAASEIFSFAESTAEKTGLCRRTIEMSVALDKRLAPDAKKMLAGHPIARNQSELIKLSKLSPDMQQSVARIIADEGADADKVAQALAIAEGRPPKPKPNSGEAQVRRVFEGFSRLSKRDQDRVLKMIGNERLVDFLNMGTSPILKAAD